MVFHRFLLFEPDFRVDPPVSELLSSLLAARPVVVGALPIREAVAILGSRLESLERSKSHLGADVGRDGSIPFARPGAGGASMIYAAPPSPNGTL